MADIMTEADWLACTDPFVLVLSDTSGRHHDCQHFRLFAVRWLEKLRHLFWDDIDQETLAIYADSVRRGDTVPAWREPDITDPTDWKGSRFVDHCFHQLRLKVPAWAAADAAIGLAKDSPDGEQLRRQFCDEFRDIVGNPFRPVVVDPAWRTETVVGLAAGIDEAEAFERLPILADALEEAGCTDPQVLSHARDPGTHIRGCWLIDAILGRMG